MFEPPDLFLRGLFLEENSFSSLRHISFDETVHDKWYLHKSVRQTYAKNAVLLSIGYKLRLGNWPLVFFLALYGYRVKHTLHSSEIFFLPRSCFLETFFLTSRFLKTYFFQYKLPVIEMDKTVSIPFLIQ